MPSWEVTEKLAKALGGDPVQVKPLWTAAAQAARWRGRGVRDLRLPQLEVGALATQDPDAATAAINRLADAIFRLAAAIEDSARGTRS